MRPDVPSLPAAETRGSRRLPENCSKPACHRTHEEPLMSAVVARARHQSYLLCEPANRNSKPTMAWVSHVGGDHAARNLSSMRAPPVAIPRPHLRTSLAQAL